MSSRTKVLWAAFGVLVLAVGMALVSIVFTGQFGFDERLLGTSITTAIYGVLGLLAGLVLSRRPRMGWWSVALLGISYTTWIVYIWADPSWDAQSDYQRAIMFFVVLAGVSLHLGLLMVATLRGASWRIMRVIAGVCSVGAGVLLIFLQSSQSTGMGYGIESIVGVLIVLAMFGTVMVPVAAAIERSSTQDKHEVDIAQRTPVTIHCPRCKTPATIPANTNDACGSCGLRIHVKIDEPRCECGYLLYDLDSEVCPECGKTIPIESNWHKPTTEPAPAGPQ